MVRFSLIGVVFIGVPVLRAQDKQESAEIRALRQDFKLLLEKVQLNEKAVRAELERFKQESDLLRKTIENREATILKLELELQKARAEAQVEKAMAAALMARNALLLQQVHELSRSLALVERDKVTAKTEKKAFDLNPPDVAVKGKILKVEEKSPELVVINLGADHGLKENHTLEVFRTSPPTYLGTIRILQVQPHQAVGRILRSGPKVPALRAGDEVASKILTPGS